MSFDHKRECYICIRVEGEEVPAVAVCNELNQPVCERHAKGCVEDGHGHRPLPKDGE